MNERIDNHIRFHIITLFPNEVRQMCSVGVIGKAFEKHIASLHIYNPRDFTSNLYQTVDDRPYGGGDGMILLAEPLRKTIESIPNFWQCKKIYFSPQGKTWTDQHAKNWAENLYYQDVIMVCGRYGGVDQRFINQFIDEEISIGNFVLSGGELAAAIVIDSTLRFVPQVLGHNESASQDSFESGLLEAPQFTRPREILGQKVPDVLWGGNHAEIEKWKEKCAYWVTLFKRPDLVDKNLIDKNKIVYEDWNREWNSLDDEQRKILGLGRKFKEK